MLISLPNDKILDRSKLEACTDDKINMSENFEVVLWRVENIVKKGKNADFQHFLFASVFSKGLFDGVLEVGIVW